MSDSYASWYSALDRTRHGRGILNALAGFDKTFDGDPAADVVRDEVLRVCHVFATLALTPHAAKDAADWAAAARYDAALPKIAEHARALATLIRENADRCYMHLMPISVRIYPRSPDEAPDWLRDVPALLDEFADQPVTITQFPAYAFARFRAYSRGGKRADRKPPRPHKLLALRLVFIFRAHSSGQDFTAGVMPTWPNGENMGNPRRALVAAFVRAVFGLSDEQFKVSSVEDAEDDLNPFPHDRFVFLPIPRA